jgi:hypothetical protein
MKVELLYFEGCPSYADLLRRLHGLVAAEGIQDEIELRRVETPEQAERKRFLGSPTVRIDGEDVDSTADGREDFGLECRLYRTHSGLARTPPDEWIRAALGRAAASSS